MAACSPKRMGGFNRVVLAELGSPAPNYLTIFKHLPNKIIRFKMTRETLEIDVLIVGAGPAGYVLIWQY